MCECECNIYYDAIALHDVILIDNNYQTMEN